MADTVLSAGESQTRGLAIAGFFGGTFDPIHNGHLRMAIELKESLGMDQLSLLPCRRPPHRDEPDCTDLQRAEMAELAIQDCSELSLDRRELQRDSLSYSFDTLTELRAELGDSVSLCWCVGMDSLVNLNSWYRWRELLNVAHLVVVTRPGWALPQEGEVAEWLVEHQAEASVLSQKPCGNVILQPLSLLAISATDIRQRVAAGNSVQFLVPDAVRNFIEVKQLYRRAHGESEN